MVAFIAVFLQTNITFWHAAVSFVKLGDYMLLRLPENLRLGQHKNPL